MKLSKFAKSLSEREIVIIINGFQETAPYTIPDSEEPRTKRLVKLLELALEEKPWVK